MVDRPCAAPPRRLRSGVGMADAPDPRADRPPITGYDQDLWADRLHYAEADPGESLEAFRVLRRDNLRLLERASPDDLKRVGVHFERGEESAGYLRGSLRRPRPVALESDGSHKKKRSPESLLLRSRGGRAAALLHVAVDPLQFIQHAVHVVPVAADAVGCPAY